MVQTQWATETGVKGPTGREHKNTEFLYSRNYFQKKQMNAELESLKLSAPVPRPGKQKA